MTCRHCTPHILAWHDTGWTPALSFPTLLLQLQTLLLDATVASTADASTPAHQAAYRPCTCSHTPACPFPSFPVSPTTPSPPSTPKASADSIVRPTKRGHAATALLRQHLDDDGSGRSNQRTEVVGRVARSHLDTDGDDDSDDDSDDDDDDIEVPVLHPVVRRTPPAPPVVAVSAASHPRPFPWRRVRKGDVVRGSVLDVSHDRVQVQLPAEMVSPCVWYVCDRARARARTCVHTLV